MLESLPSATASSRTCHGVNTACWNVNHRPCCRPPPAVSHAVAPLVMFTRLTIAAARMSTSAGSNSGGKRSDSVALMSEPETQTTTQHTQMDHSTHTTPGLPAPTHTPHPCEEGHPAPCVCSCQAPQSSSSCAVLELRLNLCRILTMCVCGCAYVCAWMHIRAPHSTPAEPVGPGCKVCCAWGRA